MIEAGICPSNCTAWPLVSSNPCFAGRGPVRDEFNKPTKDRIAASGAHYCSNPDCRRLTLGPNAARDGKLNLGVAAHITAAAVGGPRFDANLTQDGRAHADNGIWLCQVCAKLIDSDAKRYTVELLAGWKSRAQDWAFRQVTAPGQSPHRLLLVEEAAPRKADQPLADRVRAAALTDLDALHRITSWPQHGRVPWGGVGAVGK